MKPTFFVLLTMALSLNSLGQNPEDFSALASFMSQEKLNAIESKNSIEYNQLAYLNRHGYHFSEIGDKNVETTGNAMDVKKIYPDVPDITVAMVENQELNMMGYNFKISPDKYTYYSLENSSGVLVIPPSELTFKKMASDNE